MSGGADWLAASDKAEISEAEATWYRWGLCARAVAAKRESQRGTVGAPCARGGAPAAKGTRTLGRANDWRALAATRRGGAAVAASAAATAVALAVAASAEAAAAAAEAAAVGRLYVQPPQPRHAHAETGRTLSALGAAQTAVRASQLAAESQRKRLVLARALPPAPGLAPMLALAAARGGTLPQVLRQTRVRPPVQNNRLRLRLLREAAAAAAAAVPAPPAERVASALLAAARSTPQPARDAAAAGIDAVAGDEAGWLGYLQRPDDLQPARAKVHALDFSGAGVLSAR
ncbi:hypothetical protein T492DRAFT_856373 [Pavlovales sp. CCMP2436]|nr:hypothetical protein T492DRAFT_856373 [Pavlovales sp. CCMP2436]